MLDHISHSQLAMWLRCPRQWEYRYVEGLKIPPSGALIEGGCYHKALEKNFKQKVVTGEDLPLDVCLDVFSSAWDIALAAEEDITWGNLGAGEIKDEGIGLVREYQISTAPSVTPAQVEERYVSEVAGVKFVCVVDLIDNTEKVVDHKTSAKPYSQDDVDKGIQASAEAFVLNRAIMFENHVAVKSKRPYIQIVKTYRLLPDIKWWGDMASGIVIQMKTGVAPPRSVDAFGKDGWWCNSRWCGYYDRCRGECARYY